LRVARGLLRKAEAARPAAALAASPAAILAPTATAADSWLAPAAVEAASNGTLASVPDKIVETVAPVAPVAPVAIAPVAIAPLANSPVADAPLKLEVEAEPVPPLGAEEAALLESLPAPIAPQPAAASAGAKGYAWQPAAKSLPEPAPGTATPPSFPVLAKTSALSPASDQSLASPASENRREATPLKTGGLEVRGLLSGQSAATAATPAKEIPAPVLDLYETKPQPPTTRVAGAPASKPDSQKDSKKDPDRKSAARSPKSSPRSRAASASASNAFSPDEEEAAPAPEENNTKNLIIAAVLVLGLAASGYYAWPRLQPALESLPIVQKYFGAPQSEVSPPLSPAVPAPAPASAAAPSAAGPEQPPSASASGPTAPQETAEPGRAVGSAEPEPAASAAASSSASAAGSGPRGAIAHPAAGRTSKPIVVKALKAGAGQPAAPAPLEIASSSGDQAIAGIVGTISSAHPVLKPINVSQGVSNGLLIKQVPPLYPTLALQMRVAGTVELQANINKDGSTANLQVLKGDPLLRQAAVNAVRQWKYKPYRLDGQPVEIVTQVTVNFVLPQ
jgi:TonB family protein